MSQRTYSLKEVARLLGLELDGSAEDERMISGLGSLKGAAADQISFFNNPRYLQDLQITRAAAVIISAEYAAQCPVPTLVADNPYLSFARASQLFARTAAASVSIHPSATVSPEALVAKDAVIGPQAVIEQGAIIGAGVVIGAGSYIGEEVNIGAHSRIGPNVTINYGCTIGERVIIHSAVVIGADGFGFAFDGKQHVKIEQLGRVCIGDDVEIGAGTTIDRGALDNTVIGKGVKIDNLVQIGHNVVVGENTIICGCCGIGGSAIIGANCIIAGGVGVVNHMSICDGVTITAMSMVHKNIDRKGMYSSGTGLTETSVWRRNMLRFAELDGMAKKLKRLLKKQG